jgi:hypothetical protein
LLEIQLVYIEELSIDIMKETNIIAIIAALAAVQAGLILAGILPPISVNSSANVVFNVARIAIIAYAGWMLSKHNFKDAAINGAIAALAGILVTFAATFIGMAMNIPVLGMTFPSQSYLMLTLVVMLIANVFLGAIVAVIGAWLGRKFKK